MKKVLNVKYDLSYPPILRRLSGLKSQLYLLPALEIVSNFCQLHLKDYYFIIIFAAAAKNDRAISGFIEKCLGILYVFLRLISRNEIWICSELCEWKILQKAQIDCDVSIRFALNYVTSFGWGIFEQEGFGR